MRKLVFVINPISGGINKHGFRKLVVELCESRKLDYTFFETSGDHDGEKLQDKIDDYQPTCIVACGGDGTVNLVAKTIDGQPITLGIIPLGSANGMARELELPTNLSEALQVVIQDHVVAIDKLIVNQDHLCLHLCDVGLNAQLIKRFEKGTSRGKLGYARHFFETIFNKDAINYKFALGEECFEEKAEMVVFANARKYGTGAIVNPEGKINDGQFEVCIFKPYPWYAIVRLSWLFFTGQLKYSPFVKIVSTKKIKVTADTPEHLQIDGESMGKHKQFDVKVSETPLKVLVSERMKKRLETN